MFAHICTPQSSHITSTAHSTDDDEDDDGH